MSEWISVDESLPELDVPVWLFCDDGIFIGCRGEDGDFWQWGRSYDDIWYDEGWHTLTSDADDYQPTHWQALPEPPK